MRGPSNQSAARPGKRRSAPPGLPREPPRRSPARRRRARRGRVQHARGGRLAALGSPTGAGRPAGHGRQRNQPGRDSRTERGRRLALPRPGRLRFRAGAARVAAHRTGLRPRSVRHLPGRRQDLRETVRRPDGASPDPDPVAPRGPRSAYTDDRGRTPPHSSSFSESACTGARSRPASGSRWSWRCHTPATTW